MKRTTKKLSGTGLEQFLRRFYARYPAIDKTLARQLSRDGAATFSSVRIRHVAWYHWRDGERRRQGQTEGRALREEPAPAGDDPVSPVAVNGAAPDTVASANMEAAPFDPYAIGLIPTYQREGAGGLRAKLTGIDTLADLRKMARSQQVALPLELRGADADVDAVRDAIVAAVGKRIADRRAAAG